MGVPGFYSWLTKRYPLIKHMVGKHQLPTIDYLYLDMNGIIYKCVKDNTLMFKDQLKPKELQKIWIQIFNYINMIVNVLKPNKMIMMGLDGVAPRSKMNNQRARRFKSAKDYNKQMEQFRGFSDNQDSQENFKNNSISPGTKFMSELNSKLRFFIKKKIEEDDYWKSLSVVFTGSDVPGEGEHKIMEFIRANKEKFDPEDSHCLYGADADLIMLAMTLPMKNICIIRQQFIPTSEHVKIIATKKDKLVNFELIFVTILREYFEIEYSSLSNQMKIPFDLQNVLKDFVFLFFFIGNDFLPRCMAYNIRENSIEHLITAFKQFLTTTTSYVVGENELNIHAMALLSYCISQYESRFLTDKAAETEKYLKEQEKKQFDNELNQKMKSKLKKQQNFLLQLKTFYMNEDGSLRKVYYENKFQVSPAQNTNQFYNILCYYLYGLQFVFEYYFINLPSWQWYYPYYYAPLLCDFTMYLQHLSSVNFKMDRIQPGKPFEPFKQLMCILPKQSNELLPQSFRYYINDEKSFLRDPYDYYPDTFEEDLYGSVRSFQAISLIPFLDTAKIEKAYDLAIKDVSEEQLKRNQFSESTLYEYDEKAKDILIESPISIISDVKAPIRMTQINLMKDNFRWGQHFLHQKKQMNKNMKMPSLKIKNFIPSEKVNQKTKKKSIILHVTEDNQPQEKIKLGEQIFYGFPLEHSGLVEALLSFENFVNLNTFDGYNYMLDSIGRQCVDINVIKGQRKSIFQAIVDKLLRDNFRQIDLSKTKQLFFVKDTISFIRCQDGSFKRAYIGTKIPTFAIIPSQLVSKKKIYEKTRDQIIFNSLDEEFEKGEDVIVFPLQKSKNALKAKVIGHEDQKVKVRVLSRTQMIESKTLKDIVNTAQLYFTLRFCAHLTKIRPQILLTLLDSITILLQQPDLPPSIDIGLNFISRSQKKIVTNIVRINYDHISSSVVQKDFNQLEISTRGLEFIIDYKQHFPEIFKFIEQRHQKLIENRSQVGKINWRQPIKLSQIYQQEKIDKATKSLMSVYFWLVKKEETDMPLSSVFSKQISKRRIEKLSEYFEKFNESISKKKQRRYVNEKQLLVDPNYLFSRRLSEYGYFGLPKKPKSHTIRDQVICLKPDLFGEFGVIVGVDDDKYEVLFQKSSFGMSNLSGLSREISGGKFFERQLFNLDVWPQYLSQRKPFKINEVQNIGWDGLQDSYYPKFKEKPINQYAQVDMLRNKNVINERLLAYIDKIKQDLKVEHLDPDYQVVDNRKKTYEHKYDQRKVYIEKEFVEKIEKEVKDLQKPIQIPKNIQVDEFKEEVIKNKMQEKQKEKQKQQENEEEEDGEDVFKQ